MITVDITPGSAAIQIPMSRNEFEAIPGNPTKGAVRNWEEILRLFLEDYWLETPSTQHRLTPYQQWVLLAVHREFTGWKDNHTRLPEIEAWVKKTRQQLSKENYDHLRTACQTHHSGAAPQWPQ